MKRKPSVLIIDDDPAHLRIYGWIVEAAGYGALTVVVRSAAIELPAESVDAVLLDYNLPGLTTAVEIAKTVQSRLPNVPILVLSDALFLPDDIAPLVQGFVRKGDPARLVEKLHTMLPLST
jgi:CheY-like chemotaxis protein